MNPMPTVRGFATLLAAGGFVACLVVAPTAAAATLAPTQACIVVPVGGMAPVTLDASGLTPGDDVEVVNGPTTNVFGNLGGPLDLFSDTTVDSAGDAQFATTANLGTIYPAAGTTVASINDEDTGATGVASATVTVASATIAIGKDKLVRPRATVTVTASGLPGVTKVYEHAISPGSHKVFTTKLGTAGGPCGVIKTKAKALPVPASRIRTGRWTIQLDGRRRYSRKASPRLVAVYGIERY
jgi:hypothetical protein